MSDVIRLDYCPVCFGVLGYEVSTQLVDGRVFPGAIIPICKSCGWKGEWDQCLDEDEVKNSKRIKIIDKSLNEKIQGD